MNLKKISPKFDMSVWESREDNLVSYRTDGNTILFRVSNLTSFEKNEIFKDWKTRVGVYASEEMARLGAALHEAVECYINKTVFDTKKHDKLSVVRSKKCAKIAYNYINENYKIKNCLTEQSLLCPNMCLSGTADIIAESKDGRFEILDLKTSKNKKTTEDITSYMLQVTAYILMWNSLVPHCPIEHGNIIMLYPNSEKMVIFPVNPRKYVSMLQQQIRDYAEWAKSQGFLKK